MQLSVGNWMVHPFPRTSPSLASAATNLYQIICIPRKALSNASPNGFLGLTEANENGRGREGHTAVKNEACGMIYRFWLLRVPVFELGPLYHCTPIRWATDGAMYHTTFRTLQMKRIKWNWILMMLKNFSDFWYGTERKGGRIAQLTIFHSTLPIAYRIRSTSSNLG